MLKNVAGGGGGINVVMVLKLIMLNRKTFPSKEKNMERHL